MFASPPFLPSLHPAYRAFLSIESSSVSLLSAPLLEVLSSLSLRRHSTRSHFPLNFRQSIGCERRRYLQSTTERRSDGATSPNCVSPVIFGPIFTLLPSSLPSAGLKTRHSRHGTTDGRTTRRRRRRASVRNVSVRRRARAEQFFQGCVKRRGEAERSGGKGGQANEQSESCERTVTSRYCLLRKGCVSSVYLPNIWTGPRDKI